MNGKTEWIYCPVCGSKTRLQIWLVLHPVSNDTLQCWKNLLYAIKNGIGGRRHATLYCHTDKR